LIAGIEPSLQATSRDRKVTEIDGVAVETDGEVGELTGFNNGAFTCHIGKLEWGPDGVSVLFELDSVVSVGSVGRDSVGSLGDCNESSKGADGRCFELYGCGL
jgi:hypothetical protein